MVSPPLSSFLTFLPSLNSFALWVIDSEMAPYLSYLLESNKIPSTSESTQLLKNLEDKNQQYLKDLEAKLEDSKTNLGETEVSDALRDKASYLAKIGEKVKRFRRFYELFLQTDFMDSILHNDNRRKRLKHMKKLSSRLQEKVQRSIWYSQSFESVSFIKTNNSFLPKSIEHKSALSLLPFPPRSLLTICWYPIGWWMKEEIGIDETD